MTIPFDDPEAADPNCRNCGWWATMTPDRGVCTAITDEAREALPYIQHLTVSGADGPRTWIPQSARCPGFRAQLITDASFYCQHYAPRPVEEFDDDDDEDAGEEWKRGELPGPPV